MTDAKICPMQNTTCIREKCGWWSERTGLCAMIDLALSIDTIMSILRNQEDRIQ